LDACFVQIINGISIVIVFVVQGLQVVVEWLTRLCDESLHTLLISNPFICHILNLRSWCSKQYHQLFLNIPFWNHVSLVWIRLVVFILKCYRIIDSPHSYIPKIQATMTTTFSSHLLIWIS
jgi:hypothetical protein